MQRLLASGTQLTLAGLRTFSRPFHTCCTPRLPLPVVAAGLQPIQQPAGGRRASVVGAPVAQPDIPVPALSAEFCNMLASTGDVYDGINVDADQLPADPSEFAAALHKSLLEWQRTQRKGVWLKLPIKHAALVPIAVGQGFYFHHAEPDYVMMARWLPDTEDKLPPNASHQVGVGAFVFDRQSRRVLMVQERNGPLRGKGVWKMPTGLAASREDIGDAAEREVAEETGVRATFQAVLAIRQAHTALFGKSDIFAVVALEPEAGSHDKISIQEDELVAAEWQTLEQFENNPFPKTNPLLQRVVERCVAYAKGDYPGLKAEKIPVPNQQRADLLMYGPSVGPSSGL